MFSRGYALACTESLWYRKGPDASRQVSPLRNDKDIDQACFDTDMLPVHLFELAITLRQKYTA